MGKKRALSFCSVLLVALFFLSCTLGKITNPYALEREKLCVEHLTEKDYQRAKLNCELCLQFDKKTTECLNGMGIVANFSGDKEEAKKWFTAAAHQDAHFPQARNNLGSIFFEQQQYEKAGKFFQAALEIDPGFIDARYNYALHFFRLADENKNDPQKAAHFLEKAQKQYKLVLELNPLHALSYRDLGFLENFRRQLFFIETKGGRNDYFAKCVLVSENDEVCLGELARELLNYGDFSKAREEAHRCLAITRSESCLESLQKAEEMLQQQKSSFTKMVATAQQNIHDAGLFASLCQLSFAQELDEQVLKYCGRALELNGDYAEAHYFLAQYFTHKFEAKKAINHCNYFLNSGRSEQIKVYVSQCKEIIAAIS